MMEETETSGAPGVTLREQVEDLREQAREDTMRLAADARAQVEALVRRRQDMVAERLGGIAAALRDAGRRLLHEAARPAGTSAGTIGAAGVAGGLGGPGGPRVAVAAGVAAESGEAPPLAGPAPVRVDAATRALSELTESAAQQVDRASRYLRRNELRDLVRDLEELARQRPLILVGGSFAAGLLLARFFKSSGERAAWSDADLPSTPLFESGDLGDVSDMEDLDDASELSGAMAERW